MNSRVTYSLGIPVYNQVNTIGITIDSVLAQKRLFDAIWVSDNHSTDGTSDVLAAYGNRIRVIRPPTHLSMAENWNFTVEQMDCDWFSLLSGDDFILPEFADVMRSAIEGSRSRDVVFHAGIEVID
jgi:glycosyltransferase involved in cell wall biosynthesis